MFTILFIILMLVVFGKLIVLALKASWGIAKVLFTIVFLPIALVCLVVFGLIYIAIPVLVVIGIVALVSGK